MADGSSDGQGNRPSRQPKNLQGLLKFCVENTKSEDAPAETREISPERKEWLHKALDSMVVDPIQDVKCHIRTVSVYLSSERPTDEIRSNAMDSLDELFDLCESLDMAIDFVKIGGLVIVKKMMVNFDPEFRLQGFRLVGVLVQNNPPCQEVVVKEGLMSIMLAKLNAEMDPHVQSQAIHAISCLVRDGSIQGAQQQFVEHNGFEVLTKVLKSADIFRLVVKIAFFLDALCQTNPLFKDMAQEKGMVELLIRQLQGEHQQTHEHVMSCLLSLATDHPPTQRALAKPDLNMATFLAQRIQDLTGHPEFEEEREHAQKLLQMIQSSESS